MTTTPQNTPFAENTKNAEIFKTTAPYNNTYQGTDPRWLFVCTAGLLRSPTGAALAIRKGLNARSCGSDIDYALIPISANLIMWAEKIVFVNEDNYLDALALFDEHEMLRNLLVMRAIVLDIPDIYNYNNPELIAEFEKQIDWVRAVGGKTIY
jgi:predicted protein tyrosine phosphatase